uniref:FBA_2 domain-containing protein n=1 Tax=Caenorhabditis tropicalis TaxID=1561998 RepID=A0A1I7V111_9PELO
MEILNEGWLSKSYPFQNQKWNQNCALQFKEYEYRDSRWVTIEQILAMRNYGTVNLGETNMTSTDVNRLLHYWKNCREEMFEELNMTLNYSWYNGNNKNFDSLRPRFTRLSYILSNDEKTVCCIDDNDKIRISILEDCPYVPILKLIRRKRQLIDEYSNLKDKDEKRRVEEEFNEIVRRLEAAGVISFGNTLNDNCSCFYGEHTIVLPQ